MCVSNLLIEMLSHASKNLGEEFLVKPFSSQAVTHLEEALYHSGRYSSTHTEGIVTEDVLTLQPYRNC